MSKLDSTTERVMTPGTLLGVRFGEFLAADSDTSIIMVMKLVAFAKRKKGGYVNISTTVSHSEELPTEHRRSSD